jgi:glyoxylase-like metal-dependent hydrolase (beta-lactamase superfamily II)
MKEQSALTAEGFAVVINSAASGTTQNAHNASPTLIDTEQDPRELTNRFLSSLGGRDHIKAASNEQIVSTGRRWHPGWGSTPETAELVSIFSSTLLAETSEPKYRLTMQDNTIAMMEVKLRYIEIGNGKTGSIDGADLLFNPRVIQSAIDAPRVLARNRHIDLLSPLRLAHKLIDSKATPRVAIATGADGSESEVLTLTEPGRSPLHLYLNAGTGLPEKLQTTEDDPPFGDALVEVIYDDYRIIQGCTLPYHVVIKLNGMIIHDETRSDIQLGVALSVYTYLTEAPPPPAGPEAQEKERYAIYSTEWLMSYVYAGVSFYFDLQTAPIRTAPVKISEGVYIILGPSHNMLIVEMNDHVVTVDAPLYGDYTSSALQQIKTAFPDKPLRAIIGTHFHYDHIGGMRELAAEGNVTVYVGLPTVHFFERIFKSPHTIRPDRFQQHPVEVDIKPVTSHLSLQALNGSQLKVYRIPNDHADDMLIAYHTGAKIVFNSDLWNPTPVMPPPNSGRGRLATQLYDAIIDLELDVESIVGGHSSFQGNNNIYIAPLSFLKTAAGR